jgi:AcrR family transcriptional regulator
MLETPNRDRRDGRDRRAERRAATRAEILDAAWEVARADGLAAIALRDIAARVGMRAPSLYSYFDSKHAIYDAMFAQGCQAFADGEPWAEMVGDARTDLRVMARYFVTFCAEDPARFQLMFQRTIPGFEPSAESFALSQQSFARMAEHLARCGIGEPRSVDLYTALVAGLAAQQLANDPGGDRWIRLVDDAVDMFVDHVAGGAP